jgi:hypothetical protein
MLPEVTRARSTVMAWVPPPPAIGLSFQAKPCFCRFSFRTLRAAASPPEVHQWTISTSLVCA